MVNMVKETFTSEVGRKAVGEVMAALKQGGGCVSGDDRVVAIYDRVMHIAKDLLNRDELKARIGAFQALTEIIAGLVGGEGGRR